MFDELLFCISSQLKKQQDVIRPSTTYCVEENVQLKNQLRAQGEHIKELIRQNEKLRFTLLKNSQSWRYD